MKKVLLSLLVLAFVVPAMGAINITLVQGIEPNSAIIGYQCTAGEKVRAFALDIAVTDKALIVSTIQRLPLSEPNYYLTPSNAGFTSLGSPSTLRVWPYNSPAVSADVNGCILETASLYAANDPCVSHRSGPPSSGQLMQLKFKTDANSLVIGCDGAVTVSITGVNAKRGGVVLENGTTASVNLPAPLTVQVWTGPLSWISPAQAKGDATGDGTVNTQDLLRLRASWLKTTADPHGIANGQYNCAADFNHTGSVNTQDLLILRQNWLKAGLPGPCPRNCP